MRRYGWLLLTLLSSSLVGCAAFPDIRHAPTYHNPFPQLHRVAILPFYNLSSEPTVDSREITRLYYEELQKIPGFEVVPPGVVERFLEASETRIDATTDYQRLAQQLNVDVIVRGAVTEYTPYYPPRLGISVDWFAANPGFHPIPPGYGLPWGTPLEEYIPDDIVFEAEFALAKEQLKTQTPEQPRGSVTLERGASAARFESAGSANGSGGPHATPLPATGDAQLLPPDWPDPRGFLPQSPRPEKPKLLPQHAPIITHTRLYDGRDLEFTEQLSNYFDFLDDARFGGWQGYLVRSEDFMRFCCHLHITEMLAMRGGVGKSRVLWRWPISRYIP